MSYTHTHPKPNSKSPIRKMLVKKMINYYDILERYRNEKTKAGSLRNSKEALYMSNTKNKGSPLKKREAKINKERNLRYYRDDIMHKKKLFELKELMRVELERMRREDENFDLHDEESIRKSVSGFPSFMKEKNGALRDKTLLRKDTDSACQTFNRETNLKTLGKTLEEKVLHGITYPLSSESEIMSSSVDQEDKKRLYHLDVKHNYRHATMIEKQKHDFLDRKSKEIRRIQYAVGVRSKSKRKFDEFGSPRKRGVLSPKKRKKRKSSSKRKRILPVTPRKKSRKRSSISPRKSKKKKKKSISPKKARKSSRRKKYFYPESEDEQSQFINIAKELSRNNLPRKEKIRLIKDLEYLLEDELKNMNILNQPLKRSDPEEKHPIWVLYRNRAFPGQMKCINGFKINSNDEALLEVREGDVVTVEINHTELTNHRNNPYAFGNLPYVFFGEIRRPKSREDECDFIVDDNEGVRYKILIYLRESEPKPSDLSGDEAIKSIKLEPIEADTPPRYKLQSDFEDVDDDNIGQCEPVFFTNRSKKAEEDELMKSAVEKLENTNCEVYDNKGAFLGRGRAQMCDNFDMRFFTKAVLLDSDNITHHILMKRQGLNEVIVKRKSGKKEVEYIEREETKYLPGLSAKAKILTIKNFFSELKPKLIFYLENVSFIANSPFLYGEEVIVACDNKEDYEGLISPKSTDDGLVVQTGPDEEEDYIVAVLDGANKFTLDEGEINSIINNDDIMGKNTVIQNDPMMNRILIKLDDLVVDKIDERNEIPKAIPEENEESDEKFFYKSEIVEEIEITEEDESNQPESEIEEEIMPVKIKVEEPEMMEEETKRIEEIKEEEADDIEEEEEEVDDVEEEEEEEQEQDDAEMEALEELVKLKEQEYEKQKELNKLKEEEKKKLEKEKERLREEREKLKSKEDDMKKKEKEKEEEMEKEKEKLKEQGKKIAEEKKRLEDMMKQWEEMKKMKEEEPEEIVEEPEEEMTDDEAKEKEKALLEEERLNELKKEMEKENLKRIEDIKKKLLEEIAKRKEEEEMRKDAEKKKGDLEKEFERKLEDHKRRKEEEKRKEDERRKKEKEEEDRKREEIEAQRCQKEEEERQKREEEDRKREEKEAQRRQKEEEERQKREDEEQERLRKQKEEEERRRKEEEENKPVMVEKSIQLTEEEEEEEDKLLMITRSIQLSELEEEERPEMITKSVQMSEKSEEKKPELVAKSIQLENPTMVERSTQPDKTQMIERSTQLEKTLMVERSTQQENAEMVERSTQREIPEMKAQSMQMTEKSESEVHEEEKPEMETKSVQLTKKSESVKSKKSKPEMITKSIQLTKKSSPEVSEDHNSKLAQPSEKSKKSRRTLAERRKQKKAKSRKSDPRIPPGEEEELSTFEKLKKEIKELEDKVEDTQDWKSMVAEPTNPLNFDKNIENKSTQGITKSPDQQQRDFEDAMINTVEAVIIEEMEEEQESNFNKSKNNSVKAVNDPKSSRRSRRSSINKIPPSIPDSEVSDIKAQTVHPNMKDSRKKKKFNDAESSISRLRNESRNEVKNFVKNNIKHPKRRNSKSISGLKHKIHEYMTPKKSSIKQSEEESEMVENSLDDDEEVIETNHFGRINLNMGVGDEQDIEFQGYGQVKITSRGVSPSKHFSGKKRRKLRSGGKKTRGSENKRFKDSGFTKKFINTPTPKKVVSSVKKRKRRLELLEELRRLEEEVSLII